MGIKTALKVTITTLALAGMVACQNNSGSTSTEDSRPAASPNAKTIAVVNGTKITSDDFDREVQALPDYIQPMADTPEGRKELIDTLVMRELIMQQAKKDGIDKSADVSMKLAELKDRVIVDTYLKKRVETDSKISDAELKEFYEQNKDSFKTGSQIKASHILVKTEEEAKQVQEELKQGKDFEQVAKDKSIDSSASKGGDLGWFGKGSMVPPFENAAFALNEGQVSDIVKSDFGYHIIKMTGKRAAGVRDFAEVKEQIRTTLLPSKQQQVFATLKEDLKKGAKIEIIEDKSENDK